MMYGIVGIPLFGVGARGISRFHDVPMLPHLALLGICAAASFVIGVWLRRTRKSRHIRAYRADLDQQPAAHAGQGKKAC